MDELAVEVVHSSSPHSPSVLNLSQGLEQTDFDVRLHPLRSNIPKSIPLGTLATGLSVYFNSPREYLDMIKQSTDSQVVIIHKPLSQFDETVLENIFTNLDKTIFSTYDATYLKKPNSTSVLAKKSSAILSTSYVIDKYYSTYSDKSKYIPPSVDTERFKPYKNTTHLDCISEFDENKIVLGWIGNAEEHEADLHLLLDILERFPWPHSVGLRLLPGGNMDISIKNRLEELPVDVDAVGWVNHDDLPKVINTFDIGLAQLVENEFNRARSSEKVREYMSCGIPVLGSDLGENPELVCDSGGILVDSIEDWITELCKVCNNEYDLDAMGSNNRDYVVENYSIPVVAQHLEELIRTIE